MSLSLDTRLTLTSLLFSAIMKCTRPPGPLDCHSCHSPNSPKLRRYSSQKPRPGSLGRPTRFRPDLRVRKSASGPISDCVHVPGAGGLHQRVLRVAPAAEQPPGARECNPVGSHRGDSRAVTGDLRVTAGARGTAGARRGGFVAAGGAADARQRAARSDAAAAVGPPGDGRPRTAWSAASKRRSRTSCGWRTSRMCLQWKGFCI